MNSEHYAAVIRHPVGARKRVDIIKQADQFGIVVLNRNAKLREEKKEEN